MLALPLQHVLENDFALELRLLAVRQIDLLDLLVDVSLFVGQEKVQVPAAADEGLALQPTEARFDAAA